MTVAGRIRRVPASTRSPNAGVTRNLLYHYFLDGRKDLLRAVAEQARHNTTDDWETDGSIPLPERLAINNARMVAHAMEPSDAGSSTSSPAAPRP